MLTLNVENILPLDANAMDSDAEIFNGRSVLVNDWLVSHTFTA